MVCKLINLFRFFEFLTFFLSLVSRFRIYFNLSRSFLILVNRNGRHLFVAKMKLRTILRDFKFTVKLKMIHEFFLESVVVFDAMDRILVQFRLKRLERPPVIQLLFTEPRLERFVFVSMTSQHFGIMFFCLEFVSVLIVKQSRWCT